MLMQRLGGRKSALALYAMSCVTLLALNHARPESYTAVALIFGAFAGANGFVEGKFAGKPNAD